MRRRTLWRRTVGRLICAVRGHDWTLRTSFDIEWDFCYRCCNAVSDWRVRAASERGAKP